MRHHVLHKKDHILDIRRRWITQLMVLDKCPSNMGKTRLDLYVLCQNESFNIQPQKHSKKI